MSIADWEGVRSVNSRAGGKTETARSLHRLGEVRRQQGISQPNMARRLGLDLSVIRQQEQETTDLLLTTLYEWQKVLEVPVADLLVDSDAPLSPPVLRRAQMVKLMKTASAILEKADNTPLRRLVQMLVDQLLEIMPELRGIGPWHTLGQRRHIDEQSRELQSHVPENTLRRP